ncbi:hypothetical protein TorRG33x02_337850, partial [Trema orientale]
VLWLQSVKWILYMPSGRHSNKRFKEAQQGNPFSRGTVGGSRFRFMIPFACLKERPQTELCSDTN